MLKDQPDQGGEQETDEEAWVRIHPEDRLWLDDEIARLRRKRYRQTQSLKRPSIQETLRDVIAEVKTARERTPKLKAKIETLQERVQRLRARLSRCVCTSHDEGPDRDAHTGHQPGPIPPAGGDETDGEPEASLA